MGGTITLRSPIDISHPYLTVAGQTAPGGGIQVKSVDSQTETDITIKTHDVILQYLRLRMGTIRQDMHTIGVNAGASASGQAAAHNVVLDHLSISWGADEMLIAYGQTHDVTIQHSIISEGLPAPLDGSVGIKGSILGSDPSPGRFSFHHNLMAHNLQRNPTIGASGPVDVRNNVVYNWHYSGANLKGASQTNLVGNYVKPGPNTPDGRTTYVKDELSSGGGYHLAGNQLDPGVKAGQFAPSAGVAGAYDVAPVRTDTADVARDKVLAQAGASRRLNCDGTWTSNRDAVDARITGSVSDGTSGHRIPVANTYQQLGYISTPADVGGWPSLDAGTPCADGDNDGMPDEWERAHGLNPSANDSGADHDGDRYTNIEEYLGR